jgi:hypothetical protein
MQFLPYVKIKIKNILQKNFICITICRETTSWVALFAKIYRSLAWCLASLLSLLLINCSCNKFSHWFNKGLYFFSSFPVRKSRPVTCQAGTVERERSSSTHVQPWRYKVVGGQRHAPAALLPEKTHDTNCTGGLVGPPGLVWIGPEILASKPGFEPRTVQPVVCL